MLHAPAAQDAVPLTLLHASSQPPLLAVSVLRFVSQPLAAVQSP